ncbi:MAG: hypothetical protein LC737_09950 [Chloroflexi bacterium]|nr:hypothetical protein [Chloroflexota bacterium]
MQHWKEQFIVEETESEEVMRPRDEAALRAITDWSELRPVVPTVTFSQQLTLHLDGATIEVNHVGGRHAADSSVVRVNGVMFLGDCFFPAVLRERKPDSTLDWEMLELLVAEGARIYVDGHSAPAHGAEALVQRWSKYRR